MSVDRSRIADILSDQLTELQRIATTPYADKIYIETIFLSPDGDNSDGSTWETAFNTLAAVHAAASADLNAITLVVVAPGTYDLNNIGSFNITKQLHILGISYNQTIFENNNAGATGVFTISAFGIMSDIRVSCGTGNFGILWNVGATSYITKDVFVDGAICTAVVNLVEFDNANGVRNEGLIVVGNIVSGLQTGVNINSISRAISFFNLTVALCGTGIALTPEANIWCSFDNTRVLTCTTGIAVGAGNLLINFAHTRIDDSTTPIDDDAGATWFEIHSNTVEAHLIPDNLVGITVTAAPGAGNWTVVDVEIYSAAAATEPYVLTGIVYENDTLEKFELRLSNDGGTTYFWQGILEVAANRSQRIEIIPIPLNQGTQIVASIRSETGGNNMLVWLKIHHY